MTPFHPPYVRCLSKLAPVRDIIRRQRCRGCRLFSTKESPKPQGSEAHTRSRLGRLSRRLPRFLRRYTTPLLDAPITHVTSFLILHEITAVVPLFALFGVFHYGGWIPSFSTEKDGEGVSSMTTAFNEGTRKFGKWLRKRGWVDDEVEERKDGRLRGDQPYESTPRRGTDLILEFAAAYSITKVLLPVRLAGSAWATPWFARTVLAPGREWVGRVYQKMKR